MIMIIMMMINNNHHHHNNNSNGVGKKDTPAALFLASAEPTNSCVKPRPLLLWIRRLKIGNAAARSCSDAVDQNKRRFQKRPHRRIGPPPGVLAGNKVLPVWMFVVVPLVVFSSI